MKVLMFVSNPFTNDPRVYNEARTLIQAGYQVVVVAWDREKQNLQKQDWDGIQVVRLRTKLSFIHSFGHVLWNGLVLLLWQLQAYKRALLLHKEFPFSFIHCHDFDTLHIGIRLKQKLRLPLIYDAHEIYGYMMARSSHRFVSDILLWIEKRLITKVDRIATDGEGQKGYYSSITNKPISVIMNCKPLESLEYRAPDNTGRFTILYIGVLHEGRSIPMIINAVEKLDSIYCIIGGIGHPEYVSYIKKKCDTLPNVDFIGKVPLDQIMPLTKNADVVLLVINPQDHNNRLGLANKQFEAMVCGRPIICTKGTCSGEITEQEEVGLTVEYSEDALKETIALFRDNPALRERLGRNALKAAITKYNWQNQAIKLLEVYKTINGGS